MSCDAGSWRRPSGMSRPNRARYASTKGEFLVGLGRASLGVWAGGCVYTGNLLQRDGKGSGEHRGVLGYTVHVAHVDVFYIHRGVLSLRVWLMGGIGVFIGVWTW